MDSLAIIIIIISIMVTNMLNAEVTMSARIMARAASADVVGAADVRTILGLRGNAGYSIDTLATGTGFFVSTPATTTASSTARGAVMDQMLILLPGLHVVGSGLILVRLIPTITRQIVLTLRTCLARRILHTLHMLLARHLYQL